MTYYTSTLGTTGAQGNQGPIGLQGTTGADGAQGFQGPIGLQGTTGADGAQGFQGPIGLQGPIGPGGISGTTNSIPKFTSANSIGDSQIFDNGTNILIGNAIDEGYKLAVNGTTSIQADSTNQLIISSDGLYNKGKGDSTFFGYRAGLNDDTTNNANTFIGYQSGLNNTTGAYNSFFGYNAGLNNTISGGNTFIGSFAGLSNTTGTNNSFLGLSSGRNNTTGSENSFFGLGSGFNNTTGSFNSFVGQGSGYSNTTGSSNSFVGFASGRWLATGSNNSFFGSEAGQKIATGSLITIANNSVFLGYDTRADNNNQTNQIVIGYQAIGEGSNKTVIGNSSTTDTHLYGKLRVDTINNAVGDFITTSATGILQKRTTSEVITDLGIPQFTTVERESNTCLFDKNYIIGNLAPRSGNILFDFTGAELGATTFMYHDNVGAYSFPTPQGVIYDFDPASLTSIAGDLTFAFTITDITLGAEVVQIRLTLTEEQQSIQESQPLKVVQITGIEVLSTSFTLVSGLWESDITNSNILVDSSVEVIPENSTISIVETAVFLPQTISTTGSVKIFSKNQPTGDFFVTINIYKTQ